MPTGDLVVTSRKDNTFATGDRVRLNEVGRARSPKLGQRLGTVEGVSRTGNSLRVVFDGGRTANSIHRSYLEVVTRDA
jgi:hypothetical protein